MKIVYMGTPDFAVAPLEALLEAGYEVTTALKGSADVAGEGMRPAPWPCGISAG